MLPAARSSRLVPARRPDDQKSLIPIPLLMTQKIGKKFAARLVVLPFLLPLPPLPLPGRLWERGFPPKGPYLPRIQDHSPSIKREKCRIQGRGNLKLETGNWKLGTRSLGQFPFSSFHFLPPPSFKFPVSGLMVDDRPIVGFDAGCGEGYGAAWALCRRSSWTAARAWGLVGSFTKPAWYWLKASALRPAAL